VSDLPELLEAVTERMVETINALIDESGGEHFGLGDLRPLAAELIDYTLNREFGEDAALDGSQAPSGGAVASQAPNDSGWCADPSCRICRKEAQLMPRLGQCAECPYHLNGIFAQTGCPNCPNREAA
jgi:hypothetical protein